MKLSEMNERQLLFEIVRSGRGESKFSLHEIEEENYKRMKELAYPKEIVPYEDSLKENNERDVCAKCGYFRSAHSNESFWDKVNVCGEFVKSSINEKGKGQ